MATKLEDYNRCYDNAVDPALCAKIVRKFDVDLQHHEVIDREKRPSFTELNITKRFHAKDLEWHEYQFNLQEIFINFVQLYMEDLDLGPDFPSKYAFEEYRLKKYSRVVDEFKDHVDVQDHSSARRFLVIFLYLNDGFEGGTTSFPKLDIDIEPKCGRLLIFPPNWMFRHAGRPVLDDSKYIIGSYLHYL